jgi:hypothetical protein
MAADFNFDDSQIQNARNINDDEAPFVYGEEDDGRLWDLLSVYADDEATEAEKLEVEELLRSDAAYARDFSFLRRMTTEMESFEEVEPPAQLREAILNATSHRPTFSRRVLAGLESLRAAFRMPMGRYALPVGTFAAAALLTFVLWPRDNNPKAGLNFPKPTIADATPNLPSSDSPNTESINRKKDFLEQDSALKSGSRVAKVTPSPAKSTVKTEPKREVAGTDPTPHLIKVNDRTPIMPQRLADKKPPSSSHKKIKIQSPGTVEQSNGNNVYPDYAPRPMMDKDYQRPAEVAMKTEDDNPFKKSDFQPDDNSDPKNDTNVRAAMNDNQTPSGPRTTPFKSGNPLPRQYASSGDLRREREATRLGYNRSTVLSIERSELTGNVVGRF